MTNDEILQAAKEVGAAIDVLMLGRHDNTVFTTGELERFADIIEKRTIERCAHIAEQGPEQWEWTDDADYDTGMWNGYLNAAIAIRKLGEQ